MFRWPMDTPGGYGMKEKYLKAFGQRSKALQMGLALGDDESL